jgi:5-methylcytosine-specific restriction endonuclease McrBC regulatory subunit McrC
LCIRIAQTVVEAPAIKIRNQKSLLAIVGCTLYTSCHNKHYPDQDEELKEIHGSLGLNDFIKEKCNADKNIDRKNDECYAEPGNERGVKF